MNLTKKIKLILILGLFITNCQAQSRYLLIDKLVSLSFSVYPKGNDSLQINSTLKNFNEDPIWIMDKNIFNPEIRDDMLYLIMGLDLERHHLMDIVPFPLRPLGKGDSISFNRVEHRDKYTSVIMSLNYLFNNDYNKILKEKKSDFAIGELDYNRLMQSSYTAVEIDCSNK